MEKVNCKIDGQVCDIARPALASLEKCVTPKVAVIQRLLPCLECKEAEVFALRLSGLRLGKHDKHVLLAAPSSDQNRIVIDPVGGGRSAEEVHRRAIRKLAGKGLLDLDDALVTKETKQKSSYGHRVKRGYRMTIVRLTPLGSSLVKLVDADLNTGKPIKWKKIIQKLITELRLPKKDLITVFKGRLKEYTEIKAAMRGAN